MIEAVQGVSRLAYDGTTWLVPGIPEAADSDAAVDAAKEFSARLKRSLAGLIAAA